MTKGECFWKPKDGMTKEKFTEWVKSFPQRPSPTSEPPKELVKMLVDKIILGKRSLPENREDSKLRYLVNLIGMFYLETDDPAYDGPKEGFKVLNTGIRVIGENPINPSGGDWGGKYRYFCIRDKASNPQVVSFAIMRSAKEQTMLIVAVNRMGENHNSLQLDLDKFVTCTGDTMQIWHNGALSYGQGGSAKIDEVLEFVSKKSHQLVRAHKIKLGSLPLNRLISWKDAEAFVYNCIEYALVRDEFRES